MFQAGSGVHAMVLEDRNVGDTRVETELVVPSLINAQHIGDMAV